MILFITIFALQAVQAQKQKPDKEFSSFWKEFQACVKKGDTNEIIKYFYFPFIENYNLGESVVSENRESFLDGFEYLQKEIIRTKLKYFRISKFKDFFSMDNGNENILIYSRVGFDNYKKISLHDLAKIYQLFPDSEVIEVEGYIFNKIGGRYYCFMLSTIAE